jgi:[acyl-carrier-protein] S-malonyltransferase
VVPLAVSGAFHSPLMASAAESMRQELAGASINPPQIPVVANVMAQPVTDPEEIRGLLVAQVTGAVRWAESIQAMLEAGVNTFVELGPGQALSGMVRRIASQAAVLNVADRASLEATISSIRG